MITEEIAKEKCNKYGLNFANIAVNGEWAKCKINLICSICHQKFLAVYSNIHKKKDCICLNCTHNKYRLSNDEIVKRLSEFEASPVDLNQYTICTSPIDIKCKCGEIFQLRVNDIPKCVDISCKACKGLYTNKDIETFCQDKNIKLLEIKSNNKILIECSICNNSLYKTFRSLRVEKNPDLCHKCTISQQTPLYNDINIMDSWFKSNGLKADLSNYSGAKYKIPIICSCGDKFKRSWNSITYYKSILCLKCTKKQNHIERELELLIKDFKEEYEINYRGLITPQEVDIYFPIKKLAIEINGSYWHSDLLKNKDYHINKTLEVEKHGVTLLQFFDYEIKTKSDIVKSMIGARLGKSIRIYARDCIVQTIDTNLAHQFFDTSHIQSFSSANYYYGIFYDNNLIGCMSFGKPRFNYNYQYELIRFSTKLGYNIVGGASKLLKNFIIDHSPDSIISYANRRFSQGKMYEKLGFSLLELSSPGYFYSNGYTYISRNKAQKHKLKILLKEKYNKDLTEYENMINSGYYRIWDCGNLVYIWTKNDNKE